MEEKAEGRKKVRRIFTAEQKFEILKEIERSKTIKEGLAKHQLVDSVYYKWKRQHPGGSTITYVALGLGFSSFAVVL